MQVTEGEQVVEPGFEPVTLYKTHAFSPLPLPTTHFSLMLNIAVGLHDPCPCKQGLEEDTRRVQRKVWTQKTHTASSLLIKLLPKRATKEFHPGSLLTLHTRAVLRAACAPETSSH